VRKTVILDVVGLTPDLLGPSTPGLSAWASRGKTATIQAVTPAVTCTAQATYFTGVWPETHGIVANGWYFRDECEVKFWRQSNQLVQSPKVWDAARSMDRTFTCANLFGWYNMYSSIDYSVTPRPMYPADGRKIPDIYTQPAGLRTELQAALGTFPLFDFWGPTASIRSSQWIAEAAKRVEHKYDPTLTLIYLPHLDYNLQRVGPAAPAIAKDLLDIDAVCTDLIRFYESREAQVIVLSEYGITPVSRPVHINRMLRESGWIAVREELGGELLDAGASAAFAVADHQIAHVYVNDRSRLAQVRSLLESLPGVERVLDEAGKKDCHLHHSRAGDLVAIAARDAWFTYYYWLDDRRAPDFARTVDIHRKPGYDPVELLIDPTLPLPQLKVALTLARKFLGFRYLMDVISLDATLVKGSHGRVTDSPREGPLLITQQQNLLQKSSVGADEVYQLILAHLFESVATG
jgi:predicted AlkP superfamily pyrophosphatase or phosphodiesterase